MRFALVFVICGSCLVPSLAADWPQFRGPGGKGISAETAVPLAWDAEKNIRWRVELPGPGNNGSPIVSGDALFIAVASEDGKQRGLQCHDPDTGKLRWKQDVRFDGEEPTHRTNLYAGTTPVADGTHVVVWHSSAGMHCYDYDGELLWSRDLGQFIHIWGYGASPIIYKDLVINNCGPGERTLLVALDKRTGEIVWQVDEPGGTSGKEKPWIGSWSTPTVACVDGRDQILVSYPHHVKAYDPTTGKVLWQRDGLGDLAYTSVLCNARLAVAMGGFKGPAIGIALDKAADGGPDDLLWRVETNPQRIGSGVLLGAHVFMVCDDGTVQCLDVATGEPLWEDRLPNGGHVWSSLVHAAGRLYATTQDAETVVFAADPTGFEVLAVNPLGEKTNSTIAISNGRIFLRTHNGLYCIEEDGAQ